MNYEQKYKEALEWMKSLYNGLHGATKEEAEKYFPELKESEDERIRKTLLESFEYQIKESYPDKEWICGVKLKEIVAWLEKQGEQKAIDKVEPKFKVGDWIIDKESKEVFYLSKNLANTYKIVDIEGNDYHVPHYTLEEDYDVWTIQDAKDGDVLACGDKVTDCPFIFHNLTEELNPRSYCGVNTSGDFQYNDENGGFWCKSDEVRPATKEQRDTLLKAMADAGYTFDFEKKELKLLISNGGDFESDDSEQKPINDTVETIVEAVSNTSILDMIEDKDAFTNPGVFENSLGRLLKLFEKLPKQDLLDGLKFYANVVEHDGEYVKPAWSDEDEKHISHISDFIMRNRVGDTDAIYRLEQDVVWLKSLKERLS